MMRNQESVFGVVFNEGRDAVLLIKRRDIPVWVLPGGGIDQGETSEEATLREIKEETGYDVELMRKVGEYLPVNRMTLLTHGFECKIFSGISQIGAETLDVRFFPIDRLPKMPPPYRGWILDAHANHPALLRKKIEGVTYFVLLKLFLSHPILVFRYFLTKLGVHYNSRNK
jgi:8-oxo-dGTP diphosphatase